MLFQVLINFLLLCITLSSTTQQSKTLPTTYTTRLETTQTHTTKPTPTRSTTSTTKRLITPTTKRLTTPTTTRLTTPTPTRQTTPTQTRPTTSTTTRLTTSTPTRQTTPTRSTTPTKPRLTTPTPTRQTTPTQTRPTTPTTKCLTTSTPTRQTTHTQTRPTTSTTTRLTTPTPTRQTTPTRSTTPTKPRLTTPTPTRQTTPTQTRPTTPTTKCLTTSTPTRQTTPTQTRLTTPTTPRLTTPTPTRQTTHTPTRSTTPTTPHITTSTPTRQTTPKRPTTPTQTHTTTPTPTRSNTSTTTRLTTPTSTLQTTLTRPTTPTQTRPTTHTPTFQTTPTRSTTHTPTRSTISTTIRSTPRQTVTRTITPRPSTLTTSNTFSSPRSITTQQRITKTTRRQTEDTETTAQIVITTEGDKNVSQESQTDGSDLTTLYIVIAVLVVCVLFLMVYIYFRKRKCTSHRCHVNSRIREVFVRGFRSSSETDEYVYAKQNKVRTKYSEAGQLDEMNLQRLNTDPSSILASEQVREKSNRIYSDVTILDDNVLEIDGIVLGNGLEIRETTALGAYSTSVKPMGKIRGTETNSSTRKSMNNVTYYNLESSQKQGALIVDRHKFSVDKFEEYVKSKSTCDFYTEFQKFPNELSRPYKQANKQKNKFKCRYTYVYPYDTNRVKLHGRDNDFINASYIDGYTRQNEYIASLGPTKKTMANFADFWAMIWQDKVEKIVMLTKLVEETKMMCEQYWPDIGITKCYGDVVVRCKSDDVYTDYTLRTLSVSKGQTTRIVYQTHFLSWPDMRVPERTDGLLTLIDKVRSLKSEMDGPLVVHCSAGIGRSGTYIAIDILLQQLTEEDAVDVYGCVTGIIGQRVAMLQTSEQYEFIHNVLVESIQKTKSKF